MPKLTEPVLNTGPIYLQDVDPIIKPREDIITYRDIDFKTRDLIDMRVLIHHKIEQVLENASLWTNIMPEKIFNDLVIFSAEAGANDLSLALQSAERKKKEASNLRLPGLEGSTDYSASAKPMTLVP